jgi:hypothetical protein
VRSTQEILPERGLPGQSEATFIGSTGQKKAASPTKEIRVRWRDGLRHGMAAQLPQGAVWFADTELNRRLLTTVIQTGNDLEGEASYWLEVREVKRSK